LSLFFTIAAGTDMRFHILGLAHTISVKEYSACAFTQKIVNMCAMLTRAGHEIFHYGNVASQIEGTNIGVMTRIGLAEAYSGWDWRTQGFPPFDVNDKAYTHFNREAIAAIAARKEPGDFLLCPFGFGHKTVADAHQDMIVVESGIGYGGGYFAPYKVFESYALLHAYLGLGAVCTPFNDHWYDVVIPNYYDPADFIFKAEKQDYLLFLGRINGGKGIHIAEEVAAATGHKLIVAGQGVYEGKGEYRGVVGPKERAELLANAKALVCPSTYVEPFCGVQAEAMLSGTPVISTDWGAFTEYNINDVTGYRCRTFDDFCGAVKKVEYLNQKVIWCHGMEFAMNSIWPRYAKFFQDVQNLYSGAGWYARS
jgi:glycosyltransferase involved in cell wall biosynthesis